MRYVFCLLLLPTLLILAMPIFAFKVKCYSAGVLIFHDDNVKDVEIDGFSIITHTKGCKHDTFVMGDCVITK